MVKVAQTLLGFFEIGRLTALSQLQYFGLNCRPTLADWFLNGWANNTLDERAGGVLCAESVTFLRIKSADQKCAEDGRLNISPIRLRCMNKQRDVIARQW